MQCKLDQSVEYQPEFVKLVEQLPKPEPKDKRKDLQPEPVEA